MLNIFHFCCCFGFQICGIRFKYAKNTAYMLKSQKLHLNCHSLVPGGNVEHNNRLYGFNKASLPLSCCPAAVTQGELPNSGYRQGEKTLSQSDEGRGRGGDVVRVWRNTS